MGFLSTVLIGALGHGTDAPRRAITARVLRSKADAETAADAETRQQTMEQRIAAVWYLTLQKILGHSDVKVTLIYAHLAPDFIAEEMNRLRF